MKNYKISHKTKLFDFNLREIYLYRSLVYHLVKRDFISLYKQTVLGPLWYIIKPIVASLVFTVFFGNFAGIPTDGIPKFIFYLSGTVVWGYFTMVLSKTCAVFVSNSTLFSKVYFPRIILPISQALVSYLQFFIQLMIFIGFYLYFNIYLQTDNLNPNILFIIFILPINFIMLGIFSVSLGILSSALTTKYRDIIHVLEFSIQLFMFFTTVVYSFNSLSPYMQIVMSFNPISIIIEIFRFSFFGSSSLQVIHILISLSVTFFVLIFGFLLFNKVQHKAIDVV